MGEYRNLVGPVALAIGNTSEIDFASSHDSTPLATREVVAVYVQASVERVVATNLL